ncbi:hypothetical protein [Paraburkholderia sp. J67]|uniref:hypothetical protein n=1 Tax=Paraburkholderia sp. J67 TaxID=2805435 RepID=UPI002ABE9166|nr:hypothetical protein [Paraburkholderia sp. J67]
MKTNTSCALTFTVLTLFATSNVHAESKSPAFQACLKRTAHDRMTCQSGCGMILQQCYDEAGDAIQKKIDAQVAKIRSASCTGLIKKYTEGSISVENDVTNDAGSEPGWLGQELKLKLLQDQLETVNLIDTMCK